MLPLSDDEQKILNLGLAHLANFLPEWDSELRSIAAKLSGGAPLYERLKEMPASGLKIETVDILRQKV